MKHSFSLETKCFVIKRCKCRDKFRKVSICQLSSITLDYCFLFPNKYSQSIEKCGDFDKILHLIQCPVCFISFAFQWNQQQNVYTFTNQVSLKTNFNLQASIKSLVFASFADNRDIHHERYTRYWYALNVSLISNLFC